MPDLGFLYSDIVCDAEFRLTAGLLVAKSGARPDLKGYAHLIDAVILYGSGVAQSFCEIYRIIGELHRKKTKTVMREMSYCVAQSPAMPQMLTALTGVPVRLSDIHLGLVISCLGEIFKRPHSSLYD
ncbi:MAG: hypothetical protein J1F33_03875 [Clostridiales bacterium]|nr:hypothetical protein [Clostridiales bacterium]